MNERNCLETFESFIPLGIKEGEVLPGDNLKEAKKWFNPFLEGGEPGDCYTQYDVLPLHYFLDVLQKYGQRPSILRFGEVVSELTSDRLNNIPFGYNFALPKDDLNYLLNSFECLRKVPATKPTSFQIFDLYRQDHLKGVMPKDFRYWYNAGEDLRHQALGVLAVSPPSLPEDEVRSFFVDELHKKDGYPLSAFSGLMRLSLDESMDHLPELLRIMSRRRIPFDQPMWVVLSRIEYTDPEIAIHLKSQLLHLNKSNPRMGVKIDKALRRIKARRLFPKTWANLKES